MNPEPLTGYEIAQKRIEARQGRRIRLGIWAASLVVLVGLTLLSGLLVSGCTVPLIVAISFFAIMDGIQIYYASSRRAPSREMVEDEMGWLFGDDWRDVAGTQEYMLAQERIRRWRIRRAYFYLHLIVYLLVSAALVYLLVDGFTRTTSAPLGCMIVFPIV